MDPSSASSKSKPQHTYDVLINFRGEDIRRNFVSHLHSALLQAKVKTFLDDDNLEGFQIAIIIFSKNFREPSFTYLDQLAKIIESHETCGRIVVPVFYEIDRSDVRDFGKMLIGISQNPLLEELWVSMFSRWGDALNMAASIFGYETSKDRSDADLVEEIVKYVLSKLDHEALFVTKFAVGLESHVENVIGFIEKQFNKVCMIGIWGMGGSGKTTLAKAVYNEIHHMFMDKSFIQDIREVCQTDRRGHVHLQQQLLSDVLKTKVEIQSVGKGRTMIKGRLCRKRLLIVLDDVNEFGQLRDLCANREWFGQGTVIIITTRDLRLLKLLKVDYFYKMEEMNENESFQLFSWHAFRGAKPREDFNELARNIVAYCGGLPLALEVLGSYLCEKSKEEWESVFSKLEMTPINQVQKKLRKSFDDLQDQMEKDVFLDICCFFIGKKLAYVTDILNGCGLHADIGITVLTERSLIKVENNNKLGMHPLLQEMGREIIRENSRKEPGKQSRLWFHGDVVEVLRNNSGTEAIEGLFLKLHLTSRDCFETYAFGEMKRLRLLRLDYVQLTGDYGYLSKQLRWICWQGFPLKYIPDNFNLEGVVAIDFKFSSLRQVWKEPQVLQWLKILNLSHSKYLIETPDFSTLPNLEKLILKDCPRLCKVHESIGDLHNLSIIKLNDCSSLSNLPRKMYELKSLKTLILSGCSKIEKLEEDIVQMESLTTLIAEYTAVEQVPFSIVRSKSIGYISLCGYKGLSHNVFPSMIWSWMSPTMNCLSHILSFSGTSYLVSMEMQNNNLGDIAPMLSSLSSLRSVRVQCDRKCQLSKQLTILDEKHCGKFTGLEITSYTSQISNHSLESYLIGIGSFEDVFNTLYKSISEGLAIGKTSDVYLTGDSYPRLLVHTGEGHSVYFTVPKDCRIEGMALCVVFSSTLGKTTTGGPISVLIANYTKCSLQIYLRQTVISFNDVAWQNIKSHFGSGDKVEIFVALGHELVIKKTTVYLMCDESVDMLSKPSIENVYSRKRKRKRKRNLNDKTYSRKRRKYNIMLES